MEFCMRLALEEIKDFSERNICISPLSLRCMLSMVAGGAKGPTLNQLLQYLGLNSIDDLYKQSKIIMDIANSKDEQNGLELCFVNGLWVDHKNPIKPSFQSLVSDLYKAKVEPVDFELQGEQVRKEVNSWAENATRNLIKELLPPGFFTCKSPVEWNALCLANALYFKGEWVSCFSTFFTRTENFLLDSGTSVQVPFVRRGCESYHFGSFEGFKVLKLPYKKGNNGKQFSMSIFLPEENDGLSTLVGKFISNPSNLYDSLKHLKYQKILDVKIPKFKFGYECSAKDVMQKLGLTLLFQSNAELKEMVDFPDKKNQILYVRALLQKSFIELTEKGTEAASVTYLRLIGGGGGSYTQPDWPEFRADHPFMFIIMEEESQIILFAGVVRNPLLT